MYATIRQYEGIRNVDGVIKEVANTFLPGQKTIPGFVSYYFVDVGKVGGRMISVSVFETEEGSAESNRRAAAWVADHPGLITAASAVDAGPVVVH